METYSITRACGHSEEHDIRGDPEGQESRLRILQNTACRSCREHQEQALASRNAEEWNLPALTGKNAEQANVFRAQKYPFVVAQVQLSAAKGTPEHLLIDAFNRIFAIEKAEFWFAQRSTTPLTLLRLFLQAEEE